MVLQAFKYLCLFSKSSLVSSICAAWKPCNLKHSSYILINLLCPIEATACNSGNVVGLFSIPNSPIPEPIAPELTTTTLYPIFFNSTTCPASRFTWFLSKHPSLVVKTPVPILTTIFLTFDRICLRKSFFNFMLYTI